jgi:hypothetical protein
VPWLPFALPQRWPFCWWLAVVVDHFSRRVMGIAIFRKQPDSQKVIGFLAKTIRQAGTPDGEPEPPRCDIRLSTATFFRPRRQAELPNRLRTKLDGPLQPFPSEGSISHCKQSIMLAAQVAGYFFFQMD